MTSPARRLACTALTVIFTIATAVVCLPVQAETSTSHCPAPQKDMNGPSAPVMDCCVTSSHQAPALPDQTPAPRVDPGKAAAGLDSVSNTLSAPPPRFGGRERSSPLHGYHSRDLTTLYASLLI
jgi:hypothetical protein